MSSKFKISPIEPSSEQLEKIAIEAREQGYAFIDRLIDEAKSGQNFFNQNGECFHGAFIDGTLVGCGGINCDPYTDQEVGRLRHVYVLKRYRRTGIARELVRHLLKQSNATFSVVRLRTSDQNADKFYEALGFSRTVEKDATHIIEI